MIQTDGGFYLQLDIGNKLDFISRPEDLLEFSVVESSGNALPEFILKFISSDESILPLLHEGTPILATYGKDSASLDSVQCFSGHMVTTKEGENNRSFEINGLCVNQAYITDHNVLVTAKMSAIEVVIACAKRNFSKVVTNVTASKDSQVWIQPSISDKAFISKCLMHADLGTSFPICAITADGAFILKDAVVAIRNETPKWRFVSQAQANTDIQFLPDGAIENNTTFINNWTGYQKITKVLSIIKDTVSNVSTVFKPLLSMSKVADGISSISYRYKGFKIQSDAVHDNYWASADRNLVFQSQMSKVEVVHSFVDTYKPIKPLDIAFIKEYGKDQVTSSDYTSGLYFVTMVSRTIQAKKLTTTVGFNRESMNGIKNLGES